MVKKFFVFISFLFIGLTPLTFSYAQLHDDSLRLRVEPEYFSPNGDGAQDQTFFSPILNEDFTATRWVLDILDSKGRRVNRLTGPGLSALIKWDGMNKKGEIVPDGPYTINLKLWGREGTLSSNRNPCFVDTGSPIISVMVSTAVLDISNGSNELVFSPKAADESPLHQWHLQVLNGLARTVFMSWSTGSVHDVAWNGTDRQTGLMVPAGTYRTILEAWDSAGNISQPVFVDVKVNVTAKEMLKNALVNLIVNETNIGLIAQIKAEKVFYDLDKKATIKESAEKLLNETALFINAYPDNLVRIEGYAAGPRAQEKSSLYAWSIYSHLVKKGNVKASRLVVSGRGQWPLVGRRGVNIPSIKDGVEITIVGDQAW